VVYTGALGKGSVVERVTRPRTEWIPKPAPPGTIGDVTVQLTCSEISRRPAQ
jgi:hypothetical protein